MCSRYYIDDDTLDEVSGLLAGRKNSRLKWTARDVHPGEVAPIIMKRNSELQLDEMKWGFPQYGGKGLFINARAETALQKKTFGESVLHRRCVIPARHISEETGIPMRMEPRLKEQNFGRYESTPRDGKEFQIAKTHFLDHYDGGETMMQLCQRVYNLIDDIRADDRTYLLVAHNGISRVIQSYFYDMIWAT